METYPKKQVKFDLSYTVSSGVEDEAFARVGARDVTQYDAISAMYEH